MSSRLAVGAGLLAGVLVGSLALGAYVALGPPPPPPSTATPEPSADPGESATADPGDPTSPPSSAEPSGSATPAPSIATTNFHIGEAVRPLVVHQVGGGTIDLEALRGKAVWLNFMATWCPPCRDEFPVMNTYAARHADDGLVVVAVDVREEEGDVAAFAQSLSAIFPIGLDPDGSVQADWEVIALPTHFWIDADGVIRDGAFGGVDRSYMAEALRKILPGVEIES